MGIPPQKQVVYVLAFVFCATPPIFGQQQSDLPADFVQRLSELHQITNPAEYVETAALLLGHAAENLEGGQLAAVRVSVADGAKRWLLHPEAIKISPADIDRLMTWGGHRLAAEEQRALARSWLLEHDAAARLAPLTVERLTKWAAPTLSDAERAQLVQGIDGRFPAVESMSFEQLDAKMRMTEKLIARSRENVKHRRETVAHWVRTHDTSALNTASLNRLVLYYLPPTIPRFEEFQVEWSGFLTVPQTGEYTLSISPFNISINYENASHRQQMTVILNGTTVVSANPDSWAHTGMPISLTANQPNTLRVRLSYSVRNSVQRALPAQLYWSGPGVQRQIVPVSALTTMQGDRHGLNAAAQWTDKNNTVHTDQAIVPNIDDVFQGSTVYNYRDAFQPLIARRLNQLLSDDYLVEELVNIPQREERPAQIHALVQRPAHRHLLRFCSSSQRKDCALRLLQHPQVFAGARFSRMLLLHNALRFGAEREALDLLGAWMEQNPDLAPLMTADSERFFERNRAAFRQATVHLLWEHPQSSQWLEEDYLVTEDGKCSLPAAYTLAYAHLVQGRINDWIAMLDEQLSEAQLQGERRVNWLIARAMAEEIRNGAGDRRYYGREQLDAGREWLDEAGLVAELPGTKLRLSKERISRLAAMQQWDAAQAELQAVSGELADWGKKLQALQREIAAQSQQQAMASRQAYVAELERRRRLAADHGDSGAEHRYGELIRAAEHLIAD